VLTAPISKCDVIAAVRSSPSPSPRSIVRSDLLGRLAGHVEADLMKAFDGDLARGDHRPVFRSVRRLAAPATRLQGPGGFPRRPFVKIRADWNETICDLPPVDEAVNEAVNEAEAAPTNWLRQRSRTLLLDPRNSDLKSRERCIKIRKNGAGCHDRQQEGRGGLDPAVPRRENLPRRSQNI
jgi:hypothetical protein